MRKPRGFTLIEIVVVLAIVALLLSMATFATRAITIQQRISTTVTRLATVDAALLQFVMVQKRLPCPANGALASGVAGAGIEMRSPSPGGACTTNQANGVVPWTSLGISETEATDGWIRRITYRVDPNLALDSGMDMSWCDPAGSGPVVAPAACNAACTSTTLPSCTMPQAFLTTKGLRVQNAVGTLVVSDPSATPATGAAYVLISHGESGGGAFLNSGTPTISTTVDGNEEQKNYASLAYPAGTTYFVDDSMSDPPGATHFDDMLSHPTILSVISKAALGPRAH